MIKDILNFIFIYFLVFWLAIFLVLPFAIQRDENPEFKGNSSAAPKNANIKIKFLINAILSLIITVIIFYNLDYIVEFMMKPRQ